MANSPKPPVKITKDETAALAQSIARLSKQRLYVGIPDSTAYRTDDSDVPGMKAYKKGATVTPAPLNNATIAYIQNNGSPKARIPPRPFLTLGIAEAQAEIVARMKRIGQIALSGDKNAVAQGFVALGLFCQAAVRKKLTDGPWPALAPATIKERQSRRKSGKAGTKPLIDTGKLRQAINFVIRAK